MHSSYLLLLPSMHTVGHCQICSHRVSGQRETGVCQPVITGRNEVLAKVIFSQVCVKNSVHRGGTAPPPDQAGTPRTRQVHPPDQAGTPPTRQVPPRPDPPNQAGTSPPPPPGTADSGIRSTFGRYASYWNAFLFG